jgi:hypothetical protein
MDGGLLYIDGDFGGLRGNDGGRIGDLGGVWDIGGETGRSTGAHMPRPRGSMVGVNGRDSRLGILGNGFSARIESVLVLRLCASRLSLELRKTPENMYGVTVAGRSLTLPHRCDSNGSLVVAICAKVAQADRL